MTAPHATKITVFVDQKVLFWVITGGILIVLELLLPGLVVVFLGSAALIVGWLLYMNWVDGWMQATTAWFIISIFLILTVRQLLAKLLPSNSEKKYSDEDIVAIGAIVPVTANIYPGKTDGRIRYQGTDWPARSEKTSILTGHSAKIRYRDNISWVVESAELPE